MCKTIADININDRRELQCHENYTRYRLQKFGYKIKKRRTVKLGATGNDKGFRIIDANTGSTVAGEHYDLSLADVEAFWLKKYEAQNAGKQKEKFRKWLKKNNAVQIDGGWIISNDARALQALNDHITRYGSFDADGHGVGGDIASVVYRAYRPWCCPEFNRVWPVDRDWSNLTVQNLRSDADETELSDRIYPITVKRRFWHDEKRIVMKLSVRDELFFTEYSPERFLLLCNVALNGWYVQDQVRNTKTAHRLYCRMNGGAASMAEIIALHDAGKINTNDIVGSILTGKKWLRDNDLQVDHIKDNPQNNCAHNLCIVKSGMNGGKSDSVTGIMLPYVFLPVRAGNTFRVLCGRAQYHSETGDFDLSTLRMMVCHGADEFFRLVKSFKKAAVANGDMSQRPEDKRLTNCVVQMLADDGQEYHNGVCNPIERLLAAREDELEVCSGDCSLLNCYSSVKSSE